MPTGILTTEPAPDTLGYRLGFSVLFKRAENTCTPAQYRKLLEDLVHQCHEELTRERLPGLDELSPLHFPLLLLQDRLNEYTGANVKNEHARHLLRLSHDRQIRQLRRAIEILHPHNQ